MRKSSLVVGVVLVVAAGCSKKSEPPSAGGSATETVPAAGSGSSGATGGTAAAKPAPAMTPELFVTEPTKFTIEGLERGLWINENGGAFQHKCRVELGMTMGRAGKLRAVAMKAPEAVKCETKGSHAVCSVAQPDATPDSQASWVFATDDDSDETVLIAVLFGTYDWAKIELPAKQGCPRPSDDPK